MPRVVVIGPPGSGKTTVAKELSRSFGLSHIELDAVLHGPDGIESSDEDFVKAVLPELESDSWVVDGWHERKLGTLALERADVAVFLDPPLLVMCARLLRRTLPEILFRKELWNRNRQTWRGAFNGRSSLFGYALQRHGDLRRRVPRLREEPRLDHLEWVRLAGRRDVRVWLCRVRSVGVSGLISRD